MDREKILKIVTWASLIVLVLFLVWFMFGNSPTLEQIITLFIIPLLSVFFSGYEKLNQKIDKIDDKLSKTREKFLYETTAIKESLIKLEGKLN